MKVSLFLPQAQELLPWTPIPEHLHHLKCFQLRVLPKKDCQSLRVDE